MHLRHIFLTSLTFAAVSLAHANADAQLTFPTVTFDAVTSYSGIQISTFDWGFTVTGVQHGASAPSTITFVVPVPNSPSTSPPSVLWQTCERALLTTINRPGRFSLGMAVTQLPLPPTTGTGSAAGDVAGCTLTQL
jgi:hypothetical protein